MVRGSLIDCPIDRDSGVDPEAAARTRPGPQLAAVKHHPLAHSRQAISAKLGRTPARTCGHASGVGDLELERMARISDHDGGSRRAGVLDRVRERLLHDPEGGQLNARCQRPPHSLNAYLNLQPRCACPVDKRVDRRQAGVGVTDRLVVPAPQHPDHLPHHQRLHARSSAPCAAPRERRHGSARRLPWPRPRGSPSRADTVRHDVVELARDPGALLAGRPPSVLRCSRSSRRLSATAARRLAIARATANGARPPS